MREKSYAFVELNERTARRHSLRVDCQVFRKRECRTLETSTVDVSLSGIQVRSEETPEIGEPVVVSFRIPRLDRTISAEGVVRRIGAGRRRGERGPIVGIAFSDLPSASFSDLKVALKRLPPARPQRPPRFDYAAIVQALLRN